MSLFSTYFPVNNLKNDILSGITVSLALVPEAVAFSLVAGVKPLVGLYAAFIVGLITSLLGRPGMISGATGAMAVVMISLVALHGIEYLFATIVLTGILQIVAGIFKLGKFIRLVPHPVMLGFVNGLAIVIFLAQLQQFQSTDANGVSSYLQGGPLWIMLGLTLLAMAIIYFLPKLTKAIPSSLAAIIGVSVLATTIGLETKVVGDIASISGGFPSFHIPMVPLTLEMLTIIFPFALILAAIGLIESLLTLSVIDEMTDTRGSTTKECFAQGLANTVTGFFGGMGGCAMIGQSMINISSGGRTRISGLSASLFLLGFILFGSGLIESIPIAALTGVMFMVVIGTFEWSSFRILRKIPKTDAFVLILVSTITVFTDLAVAVVVGVIISALGFAWKYANSLVVETIDTSTTSKTYKIHGPLYFGSRSIFLEKFDVKKDPSSVIVDFQFSKVCDHSGLECIDSLVLKYKNLGKDLKVKNLSGDCQVLFKKAEKVLPGVGLCSVKS